MGLIKTRVKSKLHNSLPRRDAPPVPFLTQVTGKLNQSLVVLYADPNGCRDCNRRRNDAKDCSVAGANCRTPSHGLTRGRHVCELRSSSSFFLGGGPSWCGVCDEQYKPIHLPFCASGPLRPSNKTRIRESGRVLVTALTCFGRHGLEEV